MVDDVSLEFIGRSLERLNDGMREIRKETREIRIVVLDSVEQGRRLRDEVEDNGRRLRDDMAEQSKRLRDEIEEQGKRLRSDMESQMRSLRDDLELMIRSENMGRTAHIETFIERTVGDVRERVEALESVPR